MLFEMAVADAYAIPFEFVTDYAAHGLQNDLATYQQHPKYDGLRPSQYTDDTQRSIVNAQCVLAANWHDITGIVRMWQLEFAEDPRDGYSRNFQRFMAENRAGISSPWDWLSKITTKKNTNGSIMGAAPFGCLPDPVQVKLAASLQAMITHSPETIPYAQAMALAAHFFIYGVGLPQELGYYLVETVDSADIALDDLRFGDHLPSRRVGMTARDTCFAVLQLLDRQPSLSAILRRTVEVGGDTDSVAALAVGIASCSEHYEYDLPTPLMEGLEFGKPEAHQRLRTLDEALEAYVERHRQGS